LPSTIEKLYRERAGQKFAILLVDIKEQPEQVAGWVKAKGITAPVLLDQDGAVTSAYRVTATPTVYLIGRDGRLVARASGTRPWNNAASRQLLDVLIAAPTRRGQ